MENMVANSTSQTFPTNPLDWTDDQRVEYARVKIAEAIVRLIGEGQTYDQATAIAFSEVNRKWPTLLAAMLRDDRERRAIGEAISIERKTAEARGIDPETRTAQTWTPEEVAEINARRAGDVSALAALDAGRRTDFEQTEVDWSSTQVQSVVIPGARQGITTNVQRRYAAAVRREAKRRGLRVTVTIASSQRVAHVRVLGPIQ